MRLSRAMALVAATVAGLSAARAGDPDQVWKTIESEHFVIHYHEPLGPVARRLASLAERAHRTLTSAMRSRPTERTHVILRDDTDSPNGFASVVPRNEITLFVTAPSGFNQLMDHDDWLYGLFAHEYAHIVHLETISGLPAIYNKIFGKTWSPNQAQPRWMVEGLATYQETAKTSGGRARLTLFDTDLRMATLGGNDRGLDQISSGARLWPHGNAPYLYGSHFLEYVLDRYGEDKLASLISDYGSNPVPWSLNQTFDRATGKTVVEHDRGWRDYLRSRAALQVEAVERAGRREGDRLTFSGEVNFFPRYRRDRDAIVWLRADRKSADTYFELASRRPGADPDPVFYDDALSKFAMAGDGSILYSQVRSHEAAYSFVDLFWYDAAGRRRIRLTTGLRASEPALSADGELAAFVLNRAGQRVLAVMELDGPRRGEKPSYRVVWEGGRYDQAYEPAWSPDGRTIAFSAWRSGGFRDILVCDVASGKTVEITRDRAQDLTPVFSPDGAYLYFTSDRTGIYNVFAYELAAEKLWQVTNVVGAAMEPDVSADGRKMVYQGYVADGYDLYEIDLDPRSFTEAPLYVNARRDPVRVADGEAPVTAERAYRPLESLAPHSFTLQLIANSFGQAITASTGGTDAIGRHSYSLAATAGTEDRNFNVAASYTYRRLWPSISLSLARRAFRRGGFVIDGRNTAYLEEQISGSVSTALPLLRTPKSTGTLSLEWEGRLLRDIGNSFDGFDPNEQVPEFPETDVFAAGVSIRWSLDSSRRYPHTVGPVRGSSWSLASSLDHPVFGSEFRSLSLTYAWHGYQRLPWGETPVLSLRLAGGTRFSDRDRIGRFSLAGPPEQDVIDSVINTARTSSSGYLRGFGRGVIAGNQFHLANLEYRQELVRLERGLSTLPLFLRRLHAALLLDVGNAWSGDFDPADLRMGIGAALRLDAVFGYFAPGSFDLGYARGFGEGGGNEVWFLMTSSI